MGEKWHKFIPSLLWRVGTEHKTALLSSHLTSSTSSPVGWSKIFHLIYWLPSLVGWNEIFHVIHWVPQSHCALCSKFRLQQFRPAGSAWLPNSAGNSMEFCAIPWHNHPQRPSCWLHTKTPNPQICPCSWALLRAEYLKILEESFALHLSWFAILFIICAVIFINSNYLYIVMDLLNLILFSLKL